MSSASPPGKATAGGAAAAKEATAAAKDKNRQPMQIYRPPGSRRGGGGGSETGASPEPPAATTTTTQSPPAPAKKEEKRPKDKAAKGGVNDKRKATAGAPAHTAKPSKAAGRKQPESNNNGITAQKGQAKGKPQSNNGESDGGKATRNGVSSPPSQAKEKDPPAQPKEKQTKEPPSVTKSDSPPKEAAKPSLKRVGSSGDLNPQAKPFQPSGMFSGRQSPGPMPLFPLNGNGASLPILPPPKTPPTPRRASPQANGEPVKARLPPRRQNSFIKTEAGAAVKGRRTAAEVRALVEGLELGPGNLAEAYLASDCKSPELAAGTAQVLVQAAIEEGRGSKAVAKVAAALAEEPSGEALRAGLIAAAWQYFECRDKLRAEHFKFWLAFLGLAADLFAALPSASDLAKILFHLFDYMLAEPVLEELKIEELEALISALMATGYELERESPQKLAALRHRIRDAFIQASEPWARKMILLLVELSASGWKLPSEANDYYFQTVSASS